MNKTRIFFAICATAILVALASRIGISGLSAWFWRAGAALPIILVAGSCDCCCRRGHGQSLCGPTESKCRSRACSESD